MYSQGRKLLEALKRNPKAGTPQSTGQKTTSKDEQRQPASSKRGSKPLKENKESRNETRPPPSARRGNVSRLQTGRNPEANAAETEFAATRQVCLQERSQLSDNNKHPAADVPPAPSQSPGPQDRSQHEDDDNAAASAQECDLDMMSDFSPSECLVLNPEWLKSRHDGQVPSDPFVSVASPGLVNSLSPSSVSTCGAFPENTTPRNFNHSTPDSTFIHPASKVKQWLFKPTSPKSPVIAPVVPVHCSNISDQPVTVISKHQSMVVKTADQVADGPASPSLSSEVQPEGMYPHTQSLGTPNMIIDGGDIISPDVEFETTAPAAPVHYSNIFDQPVTVISKHQSMVVVTTDQVADVPASPSLSSEVQPEGLYLHTQSLGTPNMIIDGGDIISPHVEFETTAPAAPVHYSNIFDQPVTVISKHQSMVVVATDQVADVPASPSLSSEVHPEGLYLHTQSLGTPNMIIDGGDIISPDVELSIETTEVTPDQPVTQQDNVQAQHNKHRPTLLNKTGDGVRKQLFEGNHIVSSEDILVLPFDDPIDVQENVFCGEVVEGVADDEGIEEEPSTSRKKRKRNNNVCNEEPLTKKRQLKPSAWKANQAKLAYNSGLPHTSLRGKEKAGRSMKEGCGETCRKKCQSVISTERRQQLFEKYWGLKDKMLQWYFLSKLIHVVPIQRRTVVAEEKHFRMNNYEYSLSLGNENTVTVCQKMFLDTFDISLRVARTAISKNSPDKRGKHDHHKKLSLDLINGVKNHIKSFPMVESHYCRADSRRMYLDEHLNVAKMHRLYMMERDPKHPDTASQRQYRDIFNNYFNLSFFKPKKDQCSVCVEWKSDKEKHQAKYEDHQNSKKHVRGLKAEDKAISRAVSNGTKMRVITCDMQKVLYCPKSELGDFYYKRKLSVYNFTIFDCTVKAGHLYVWDETIGKKGSDETSSFLQHYIESLVNDHSIDTIVIYSDSCGGQNKNQFLFTMYYTIAMRYKITIIQRYLEKGHTQMECDSVHARVEKKIKKQEIFVPSQYYGIMRTAKVKKPTYVVHEVKQSEIYHYRDLAPRLQWDKVQVSKLKEIQIGPTPGVIKFKHNWTDPLTEMPILSRKVGRQVRWDTVRPVLAHSEPLPVRAKLKTDLAWMVKKGYIPQEFVPTYNKWTSVDPTHPPVDIPEEENDMPVEVTPNEAVENELMQRVYENVEFEMANPLNYGEENEDEPEERSLCGDSECEDSGNEDND